MLDAAINNNSKVNNAKDNQNSFTTGNPELDKELEEIRSYEEAGLIPKGRTQEIYEGYLSE